MNNLPKTDKKFKPTYKVIILGKDGKKYTTNSQKFK